MPQLTVREATIADAEAIAGIHVRSWQAAYRGLIDQAFLDALSIADRTAGWRGIFTDPHPLTLGTLVGVRDDTILGWVSFGASRDEEEGGTADGEIYGIYADPLFWSTGVGAALLSAAERRMTDAGHARARLWVLDGNDRADGFYARHGWAADGATKVEERPGLTLAEHRRMKLLAP
ncbi:Mycothiol acetyltransferase [Microbacterium oxydans]|uniref:Mycothiol acetyltransferase n=1 Tax=Microbacterium oxydans TaxID=82380 RepID=A0A0F0LFY9_9MICO|nr:GNAT family N-acetyltransferase [Microbacterium oxydans]KJL31604.1 Mycothiol acetyltransferase [Microbacterium oxydans]CAH0219917.1 Mycothiol acetyltransferase [Microbacterium oxydans]